jgi:transposase
METPKTTQTVAAAQTALKDIVLWSGIDWADEKHCLFTCLPNGSQRQMHWVEQKPQALDDFFLRWREKHPNGRIGVVLEQSRGALLYALLKYDFLCLIPVNPRCLADFRAALRASGAKDDPCDAELLCEFGCKHSEHLRPFQLDDPATRQLILLGEQRRGIVEEQTRLSHQLNDALKCYYPLARELFSDNLVAPIALAFLKRWPNLSAAKKAKESVLRAFFYAQNCRSEEKIQFRLDAIKAAKPLTEDPALIRTMQLLVETLLKRLAAVQQSIALYDERSAEVFATHSKAPVFASFPGAGKVLAVRLTAAFGTTESNFPSATNMQCWSGVAPVKKQSGKSKAVYFRWARPVFLHQTFVEYARSSVKFSAWARAFFKERADRGWNSFRIYRALAFKWIRILWRCWKNNEQYNEAKYLQSLQKRGLKTYAGLVAETAPAPCE